MNDLSKRILEAAKEEDFEELGKASKDYLYGIFSKSYLEELNSGTYFATKYPAKTDEHGNKTQAQGNPIDNNEWILDREGLTELNSGVYSFVTLFEAALIIGLRINPRCPECLMSDSVSLFLNAALKREIDPRTPLTHIPYSKAPPAHKVIDGEIIETKEIPDMSWTLTLKEVAEFAILKGYPEHIFIDLLSDTPTIDANQPSPENQGKDDANKQKNDVKKSETEHSNPNKSTQLNALNKASVKFWSNADQGDKGTWPKTQDVIDFLIETGFSKTLAAKGASIVRPEWAESGRIPLE